MMPIIHCALAEVIQVGRSYDQVPLVFDRLLTKCKKASLIWIRAENLKWSPTESLKKIRGHSFIILNKVGGLEPETWEEGLFIDPMDDKIASLKDCAPPVNGNLDENYRATG